MFRLAKKLLRAIKPMAPKKNKVAPHNKVTCAEKCLEQNMQEVWTIVPTQKMSKRYNFQQRWQRKIPPNVGIKKDSFVVQRQILFVPWTKC